MPIIIFFIFVIAGVAVAFAIFFEKRRRKRATQGRIVTENRISIDVPSINQNRPYYSNNNLFFSQNSNPNPSAYFENVLTPSIHTLNHVPAYQANNSAEISYAEMPMTKLH